MIGKNRQQQLQKQVPTGWQARKAVATAKKQIPFGDDKQEKQKQQLMRRT
jgi:hypothetical protein